MFQEINLDDEILNSPSLKKDEITFNLIPWLIKQTEKYPAIRCYSDGQSCVFLNTGPSYPVILWTSEGFDKYDYLYDFLNRTFSENNPLTIMSKYAVYDFFEKNNLLAENPSMRILGAYQCTKLKPVAQNGYIDCAKEEDVEELVKMFQAFYQESLPEETHTFEECLEETKKFLVYPETHKIWKDTSGKIVCLGRLNISDQTARIGHIFTVPEHRGKSYAKMLVSALSDIALKMNLKPVLYTNFQYEPSNKCYQAVGFELLDKVYTYNIKKINTKHL